ncbi:MAG: methionine--tRNA ligase, partial [Proteobacteria bacterium]|nr:methionine--tRNA ligase [Pseudomonadota bacterium]
EIVRQFGILIQPVMPESAAKLLDLLAISPEDRSFASLGEKGRLQPGAKIPEPQGVFPRYVEPE